MERINIEPIISIRMSQKAKFNKAMKILEGLCNTMEVAMIDDEFAQFSEALTLLYESQGTTPAVPNMSA